MMFKNSQPVCARLVILLIVGLSACTPPAPEIVTPEIPTAGETPTVVAPSPPEIDVAGATAVPTGEAQAPPSPKELTVCTSEPDTLYVYGTNIVAAANAFHAIYTNDITQLSFGYQAEGLEKLPSLADGDAIINEVTVSSGDRVVDAKGDVMVVAEGVSLTNAAGETVTFTGEPVIMPQMAVDFTMKQRYWSDGTPVTAADSVYSFGLAADPDTDTIKSTIERTISYEATGELSTRWMGVPGYLDSTFFTNFWQPLPKHAWGSYSAADLLDLVEVNRRPLGDGAFMIEEWVEGDHIRFVPNPFYYRADEGLPYLDSVIYKFIGDDNQLLTELIAGACDIATRGNLDASHLQFLLEAEANGLLVTYTQIGTVFEHIDFGVNSYGDYGDDIGRPDWFEDVRVRQAITICTDRQRMVDEIFFGRTEILHTYIPGSHPLYAEGLTEWPYDVEQANALLDETGFLDADADGWREDPATGTPFRVTLYGMTDNEFRRQAVEIFKENMSACGIDVELILIPFSELVADGPEGVLFGRQFDLGIFAWLTGADPSCGLFTSNNITGSIEEGFGGWGNSNNTGWSNEAYDAACQQARSSLPGTAVYEASHKEAQRIFTQELPIIPLFINIKVAATRPEVLNFGVDPSQNSELYNIYQFDLQR